MLYNKNVTIPRAIWYARVLGANETVCILAKADLKISISDDSTPQLAMRARPNFNPTQYSTEWANVLTSYLKKQLGEITLPVARPGLNVKQTFKGVLNDPDTRERWTNRFSYRSDNPSNDFYSFCAHAVSS
jgi:mediator of RNA polymerase II transcription subunit 12, fungi type